MNLKGELQPHGRSIQLLLDDQIIQHWSDTEIITLDLPIPVPEAGYHTLTLTLDPPCPAHFATGLRCQSVEIGHLALTAFVPKMSADPIQFDRGITLQNQRLESATHQVSVQLLWQFAESRTENDIRFVHVVDENGDLIAQSDQTLSNQSAGSAWVEQVVLADIPAGTYAVYTGWYTYPDLSPLTILTDTPDATNNRVLLGTITVEG